MINQVIEILEQLKQKVDIPLDYNFPKDTAKKIKELEELELNTYNYALDVAIQVIKRRLG
jgi:biotin synthase-like enzyme